MSFWYYCHHRTVPSTKLCNSSTRVWRGDGRTGPVKKQSKESANRKLINRTTIPSSAKRADILLTSAKSVATHFIESWSRSSHYFIWIWVRVHEMNEWRCTEFCDRIGQNTERAGTTPPLEVGANSGCKWTSSSLVRLVTAAAASHHQKWKYSRSSLEYNSPKFKRGKFLII